MIYDVRLSDIINLTFHISHSCSFSFQDFQLGQVGQLGRVYSRFVFLKPRIIHDVQRWVNVILIGVL